MARPDEPRHKVVRDLHWMMASPGMLRSAPATERCRPLDDAVGAALVQASTAWLEALDADPSDLIAFLSCPSRRSTRLGFYAQSLVEFWIAKCPALRTKEYRCGQQLRRDKSVVGSLKYVFCAEPTDDAVRAALGADPPGTAPAPGRVVLCHWELSIKFFVYVAPPAGEGVVSDALARFVGPFLHENLDARLATSARKLKLSAEPDVRQWATKSLAGVEDVSRCLSIRASSAQRSS
mmetsp:Transcript_19112/g.59866  ORF Transcript_19112/g.59866 Transcript_19112/m.59866 type:complete len:236 (-) Transcript_19112:8-715(-)